MQLSVGDDLNVGAVLQLLALTKPPVIEYIQKTAQCSSALSVCLYITLLFRPLLLCHGFSLGFRVINCTVFEHEGGSEEEDRWLLKMDVNNVQTTTKLLPCPPIVRLH